MHNPHLLAVTTVVCCLLKDLMFSLAMICLNTITCIAFSCRQHDTDMRIQCCCMAAECLSISNCWIHIRKDLTHVARIHRIPLSKACWADSIGYIRDSLLLSILLLPKPIQSTVTGTLQATCLAVGKVYVEINLFMYLYKVKTISILR